MADDFVELGAEMVDHAVEHWDKVRTSRNQLLVLLLATALLNRRPLPSLSFPSSRLCPDLTS